MSLESKRHRVWDDKERKFSFIFHVNTSLVILRYSIYFNFLDAFALYYIDLCLRKTLR